MSTGAMTVNRIKRKLTTIFCADVQSYSTLMAGDESDTLNRLRRYRAIMDQLFARHDGRKVNTWGDAVIAEFSSVVEAVRCGVEIQDAFAAENRDLPAPRQMWFRIGINLGDVMEDGTDLYGDGVNVAARLESLADPGGIMVSATVFDLTHKHLAFSYDFAGEQKVKGQETPIASYRVRMPGRNANRTAPASGGTDAPRGEPVGIASHGNAAAGRDRRSRRRFRHARPALRMGAWYQRQEHGIRIAVASIVAFAALNLLTTGLSEVWFIYPSIPFGLFLIYRLLARRT